MIELVLLGMAVGLVLLGAVAFREPRAQASPGWVRTQTWKDVRSERESVLDRIRALFGTPGDASKAGLGIAAALGFLSIEIAIGLAIVFVIALAVLVKNWKGTSRNKKSMRWGAVGVALITGGALFAGTVLNIGGHGPGQCPEVRSACQTTSTITLAETATANIYNFADFSTDGSSNPTAISTDIVVNDASKSITLGLTTDYTANALYGLGTTTAFDTWGVTVTVSRTDNGWYESGVKPTASVSFSVTGIDQWFVLGNGTATGNHIMITEQNSLGVFMVAWEYGTSFGSSKLGYLNGGNLCELAAGSGCSVRISVYYNEDALPRSIPFASVNFNGSLVIAMQYGPTVTVPISQTVQSQA